MHAPSASNPVVVHALRGDTVESLHRGAWAVVDAAGGLVAHAGDIDRPVFPRSAVKVLQALPLVESGAADRYALTDASLALACASHGGEPAHVQAAAATLAAAGLDASVLECGAHWPYRESAQRALAAAGGQPTALHNNCSGKHAGFVCLGCHIGGTTADATAGGRDPAGFLRGYVERSHPVMREVEDALQAATGCDLARAPAGIDGCSIPTHAVPLRALGLAFARVGTGVGLRPGRAVAAARLRRAVAREPFLVAGTDRLDSRLMAHFGERVFCKVGAEGVYCAALPQAGMGVALKIDDGTTARAAEVLLAALLLRFLPGLDDADSALLSGVADTPLVNWRGTAVGRLRAVG